MPKLSVEELLDQYGNGQYGDQLADARRAEQDNARRALEFSALDQIAKSSSGGLSGQDTAYWNSVAKAGQGAVDDVKSQRDEVAQAIKDRSVAQDIEKKSAEMERTKGALDANNTRSAVARAVAKRIAQDAGMDPSVFEGASAQDIHDSDKDLQSLELAATRRANSKDMLAYRDSQLDQRQDFTAHQKLLGKLRGDKTLSDTANRAQNVANAVNNVDKLGGVTPQDLADLQQLIIGNMGMQGSGGVGERAERYAKSLGINADSFMQFLTGKPQDIGKDHPIYKRFKELGSMEIENFKNRANQRVKALTSGNKSIYQRRPDLQADLDDAVAAQLGQIPASPGGAVKVKVSNGKETLLIDAADLPHAEKDGYRRTE